MVYHGFKYLFRILFFFVFRIKITGRENIPKSGGFVIVSNHKSNFDPFMVAFITRRPVHFMAKSELFDTKFKNWLFTEAKTIKVSRGSNDIGAMKKSLSVLKKGEILGIFPEGTRVKDGSYEGKAKSGAVMLAHRSKVNILPVSIDANYKLFSRVNIRVMPMLEIDHYVDQGLTYEEISDILMKNIYKWGDNN